MIDWVKLSTAMFDDEKLKAIRSMPSGNDLCLIWIQLICLAGKVNNHGQIYLSEDIPYTDSILASSIGHPVDVVRLALRTFQKMGMIEILPNETIALVNWSKYQSIEGLERVRELTRLRTQKYRQKLLEQVTSSDVTVTLLESESDLESDKTRKTMSTSSAPTPTNVGRSGLPPVVFNWQDGTFSGVSDQEAKRWEGSYPACDVELEITKAAEWLLANPKQRKKNYRRFLTNWLSRTQERGGSTRKAK